MHKNLTLDDLPTCDELRLLMVPDISREEHVRRMHALDEALEALHVVRAEQQRQENHDAS